MEMCTERKVLCIECIGNDKFHEWKLYVGKKATSATSATTTATRPKRGKWVYNICIIFHSVDYEQQNFDDTHVYTVCSMLNASVVCPPFELFTQNFVLFYFISVFHLELDIGVLLCVFAIQTIIHYSHNGNLYLGWILFNFPCVVHISQHCGREEARGRRKKWKKCRFPTKELLRMRALRHYIHPYLFVSHSFIPSDELCFYSELHFSGRFIKNI